VCILKVKEIRDFNREGRPRIPPVTDLGSDQRSPATSQSEAAIPFADYQQ
jgi:hypothetical protein